MPTFAAPPELQQQLQAQLALELETRLAALEGAFAAHNMQVFALELYRLRVACSICEHPSTANLERLNTLLEADPEGFFAPQTLEQLTPFENSNPFFQTLIQRLELAPFKAQLTRAFTLERQEFIEQLEQGLGSRDQQITGLQRIRGAAQICGHVWAAALVALERHLKNPSQPLPQVQEDLKLWERMIMSLEPVNLSGVQSNEVQSNEVQNVVPSSVNQNTNQNTNQNVNQGERVRVLVSSLDSILAEVGEMKVSQIRIAERHKELQGLTRELRRDRRLWRAQRLSRKSGDGSGLIQTLEGRFLQHLAGLEQLSQNLLQDLAGLRISSSDLQDQVMGMRLLPAAQLFPPLERMVRDLCQQLGKKVRLELRGGEIELDRKVLEGLRDPLMHMIRNALDHGIESPSAREAIGKNPEGKLRLELRLQATQVDVLLEDDGAGMNPERIRERAVERGLISAHKNLSDAELLELIFEPGFSTAQIITDLSGRGVGMDVVRQQVGLLGGSLKLESQFGLGSRFTLRLPMNLATSRVLLVQVGSFVLALPTVLIERTVRLRGNQMYSLEGQLSFALEGRALPLLDLAVLLNETTTPILEEEWQSVLLLKREDRRLALRVTGFVGEQEVVIRPLGFPLSRSSHLQGAAMLGTGALVPILNVAELFARGVRTLTKGAFNLPIVRSSVQAQKPRVLVVDDSITSRSLERAILEAAGYRTLVAEDGWQALEILALEEVQLVVSDVEMPRLDGYGLTEAIRRDERLKHLPIILITSLARPEDRARGAQAGADAYIVKGEFDQRVLLETLRGLL